MPKQPAPIATPADDKVADRRDASPSPAPSPILQTRDEELWGIKPSGLSSKTTPKRTELKLVRPPLCETIDISDEDYGDALEEHDWDSALERFCKDLNTTQLIPATFVVQHIALAWLWKESRHAELRDATRIFGFNGSVPALLMQQDIRNRVMQLPSSPIAYPEQI